MKSPIWREGLRWFLKIDFHILAVTALLAYCWLALDTVSFKLSASIKPTLSFYDLLKFINNDNGLRNLINLRFASPGIHGVAMSVALLMPFAHCWYPHKYTFIACAAPLAYMGLAAIALHTAMLHRFIGLSDAGAFIAGQQGRATAGQVVNDMFAKVWAAMSFESGFYIAAAMAAYLTLVGVVKYALYMRRRSLRHHASS